MNIVVPVRLVPDLVEELTIDDTGTALDTTWLRLIISEFDDHALEQAILLKERYGGQVTVVAPAAEGVDDVLFAAAAKDADRLIRLSDDCPAGANSHCLARNLANLIGELQADLVLTGVQAHSDLDGSVGPLLAAYLGLPYIGYVAGVSAEGGTAIARKEYPGGLIAEMAVQLPAVLGVQAAEQPPRYVAVSKVRQAMKTATIEERSTSGGGAVAGPTINRMYPTESAGHATMIDGDEGQVADTLVGIFGELGLL